MAKKRRRGNRDPHHLCPKNSAPHGQSTALSPSVRRCALAMVLTLLVFLIYSNTLNSPFVFDDINNIRSNDHIRINNFSLENLKNAGFKGVAGHRPVANISFALNYYIHRYDVRGYHMVNILIHVTAGIILYLFVQTTLALPPLRSKYLHYKWVPFFTAVIWLVHPIQTESITYIVQRMNSLAAMFYILSLLLYAKGRLSVQNRNKRFLFAGCILAGLLSIGSKEIAATLPLFILLYEWYFFQDLSRTWLKNRLPLLAAIFILLTIISLFFLGPHPIEKISGGYRIRDFTMIQRLLTEFRVVIFYISLLILPHPDRLNLDHDFSLSVSPISPLTTLLAMMTIAGLLAVAIYLAKKERLLSFCILWFLGNLVIESSIIGLEIVFDHRTYLPSMLVILMGVSAIHRAMRSNWPKMALLCGIALVFSFWTYQRNSTWSSNLAIWADCARKSPNKARPHSNLGAYLSEMGNIDQAMYHFSEALRINPNDAGAHVNLGGLLAKQGQLEKAIYHFTQALRIRPTLAEAHYSQASALQLQGKLSAAISHFSEAVRLNPDYTEAHLKLALIYDEKGMLDDAISHYAAVLRIKPRDVQVRTDLAITLARNGDFEEAARHLRDAIRIKPDDADLYYNLGSTLANQGKLKEAKRYFSEALRIDPGDKKAQQNVKRISRELSQ